MTDRDRAPKPSRRKVLTVAVTAFAGVATSRLLGLRDLDQRVAAATRSQPRMEPSPTMEPPETYDAAGMGQLADPATAGGAPAATASAAPAAPAAAAAPLPALPPSATRTAPPRPASPAPSLAADLGAPTVRGSSVDWVAPLDTEAGRIAHLLRRATFGATAAELERARSDGYAKTVDRLLDTPPAAPPDLTDVQAKNLGALQTWWLDHMTTSPTPFAEVLTLFWSGHFTSDYRKVGLQQPWMHWQNLSWRAMALGNLRSMLKTVTIDPATLRYLDLGVSTGRAPNENYARELLELFTMGVGTYTEADVQAGAKALAGWRLPQPTEAIRTGVFEPARAYNGILTFLGRTGRFDTDGVIDQILAQDATATHIVRSVLAYFHSPFPPDGFVSRLAGRFRASRYDVKALFRDLFLSPEFVSADAYRALVKSPTELMVGTARLLGVSLGRVAAAAGSSMGQTLFDPPSVGGWPGGSGLISSNTMVARANFVVTALAQVRQVPSAADAHLTALDGVLAPRTVALLNQTFDDRTRWSVILSAPEFQLR